MSLLAALKAAPPTGSLTDATGAALTKNQLLLKSHVLARALSREVHGEYIGVMLPTSAVCAVAFFALHVAGRIPAMLNFGGGIKNALAACRMAQIRSIVTARAFVGKAKLEPLVAALEAESIRIIYLEDIRARLTLRDKLLGALTAKLPAPRTDANAPAALLFTSGSEGVPKGVALSHANILANIAQAQARFAFVPSDVMFNALPAFHSFGLTIGMILPLILGFRAHLYPTPLHYQTIPRAFRESGGTILVAADTFFAGWARYAEAEDFARLRLAVAGAEKLKAATRETYMQKFCVDILEGYGVTETSPAISANTHDEHKPGTVGKLFPGMEARLEPVEGIAEGGRLWVKGANVMLGYMKADKPGVIQPQGEWYDTGDIVAIDADGYLRILGRARRFAKVGGEMVSLAAVEEVAAALWPDHAHAAIAIPDAKKGEQIVLLSEFPEVSREAFMAEAKASGLSELAFPKRVEHRAELPRLGSGKVDYAGLREEMDI